MKKMVASFNDCEVTVKLVSPRNPKLDGAHGITYFDEGEIFIRRDLTKTLLKRTIIHELTHYALYAFDKSANDTTKSIGFKNEEELCLFNERALPLIYEQAMDIYSYFVE